MLDENLGFRVSVSGSRRRLEESSSDDQNDSTSNSKDLDDVDDSSPDDEETAPSSSSEDGSRRRLEESSSDDQDDSDGTDSDGTDDSSSDDQDDGEETEPSSSDDGSRRRVEDSSSDEQDGTTDDSSSDDQDDQATEPSSDSDDGSRRRLRNTRKMQVAAGQQHGRIACAEFTRGLVTQSRTVCLPDSARYGTYHHGEASFTGGCCEGACAYETCGCTCPLPCKPDNDAGEPTLGVWVRSIGSEEMRCVPKEASVTLQLVGPVEGLAGFECVQVCPAGV